MCTQLKVDFLVKSDSTILYFIGWYREVLVWIKLFSFFKVKKKKKSKIGYSPVCAVRELEEFGLVWLFCFAHF